MKWNIICVKFVRYILDLPGQAKRYHFYFRVTTDKLKVQVPWKQLFFNANYHAMLYWKVDKNYLTHLQP